MASPFYKTLYFRANGVLSFEPPAEPQETFDEYVSDPAHPVPFLGYTALGVPPDRISFVDATLAGGVVYSLGQR